MQDFHSVTGLKSTSHLPKHNTELYSRHILCHDKQKNSVKIFFGGGGGLQIPLPCQSREQNVFLLFSNFHCSPFQNFFLNTWHCGNLITAVFSQCASLYDILKVRCSNAIRSNFFKLCRPSMETLKLLHTKFQLSVTGFCQNKTPGAKPSESP